MIAEKKFRKDLFYRLHVLPIHLPPLRQRPTDIMVLAAISWRDTPPRNTRASATIRQRSAASCLPSNGLANVRQLQNLVRRLVVIFDGSEITAQMLGSADIETRGVAAAPESTSARRAATYHSADVAAATTHY
ncbi:MAG: hypothetical protein MO846_00965 [Candidatus Devosia symbiotica]|nr:hypothetical protein [Candidatus Devosia symbiotica]